MTLATRIQKYSLAPNKVGELIGPPSIIEHKNGEVALTHLWQAMDCPDKPGEGRRFEIGIDGEFMPFDSAYARIFGERPIYRDNKRTLYPKLPNLSK